MKKIEKLLKSLNLIYYEYDEKTETLVVDKQWSEKYIFSEFMKITNILSLNHINFFVDKNSSIIISDSNSFVQKMKRYTKNIVDAKRNAKMDIYVLNEKRVKWAKNLPVFEINFIKQEVDLSLYDALIFTSKNGVYGINSIDENWKKMPSYVIAPQTAKIVNDLGGTLKFVGKEKHGNEFAKEIVENFKNKKILYIRGLKVVSDFTKIVNKEESIVCDELIVYETVCKEFDKEIKLPKNSTIIFSSPSTIRCFFKNISWDESFQAISIGKTTAKHFPVDIVPIIADTTSLDSCVKKAIELN